MAKSSATLERQMRRRGWTWAQVAEAVARGGVHSTINLETGAPATRYVHPQTGRSVVIDVASGDVIHVGGDGFLY